MIKENGLAIKQYESKGNSDLEKLERYTHEVVEYIKSIERQDISLGSGRTAEVFGSQSDPGICYKIIHSQKYYVNDVEREGEFLSWVSEIQVEGVKTPKPYYSVKYKDYHVMVMERLNAVSVKDIIENGADLPVNFNFNDFFKRLSGFLKELHGRKIYHRDMHAGNVMIDIGTGRPCVIDFGSSKKSRLGSENPYRDESVTGGKVTIYTSDPDGLTRIRTELGTHIAKNKK